MDEVHFWGWGRVQSQDEIAWRFRRSRSLGVHNMPDEEIEKVAKEQWEELERKCPAKDK